MLEWAYSGVNQTVPRNAGPACATYLDPQWRRIETCIVLAMGAVVLKWAVPRIQIDDCSKFVRRDRGGRRTLLVLMSLIWGMEIGYKFSSRTVIYLLNPCHITTAVQIYLLAASPNKMVTAIFRIHLNLLNGPLLAFLFPETDSRMLPLEEGIYWIQHGMMFVVPFYLLRLGGVYNVEGYTDLTWAGLLFSGNIVYHFLILQPIAIPTQVNLNHMICPAILDPFNGPYYRISAVLHQAILCPLINKFYCRAATFFLTEFGPTRVKRTLRCELPLDCPPAPLSSSSSSPAVVRRRQVNGANNGDTTITSTDLKVHNNHDHKN